MAQSKGKDKEAAWDVNAPPLKTRQIPISVDEGTWMNLDVSPDGRTIAFDLLGDIYTIPIEGGPAKRIAEGLAFEQQPRFSPDGSMIAFTSDRGGGDNIWIMNSDGSNKRALTSEDFRLLNNPTWSPDGQYIAARKHFTTQRSAGTGEIWLYNIHGGKGVALVKRPNEQHQKELGEPIFAPDGKHIYYAKNATPGGTFEYAQDSNRPLFVIDRYDMESGEIERIAGGPGGAVRPTPSPDGRWLAMVRRERAKSKLYIKDLASGEERKIYDDLDQDLQETWAIQGVYPNMDWAPDGRLVFWAGGKIRAIDPASGQSAIIPFSVNDSRTIIDPVRPKVALGEDVVKVRMPRFASVSPDGAWMVYEALGKLYVQPASGGTARPLVANGGSDYELFPAWLRDGSQIAYVSWDDQRLGELRVVPAGGGDARAVSTHPGHYRRPAFSPDGRYIAYESGSGGGLTSDNRSGEPGIYLLDLMAGTAVRIVKDGFEPQFGQESDRIYFSRNGSDGLELVSASLAGHDERVHASGELVANYRVSPDGRNLAFRENYAAYVMPFPPGGAKVGSGKDGTALPVVKVSEGGATYPGWSSNGATLNWSLGPAVYSARVADMFAPASSGKSGAAAFSPPKTGVAINVTVAADKPAGLVALTHARVVTMADADGGVLDDATILIRDNRIVAIGNGIAIPGDAKQVDLGGKTVIPGLIDAHAHGPQGEDDLIPQQNWSAISHLALGVTTIHDPSNSASEIFAAGEYQRAGKYLASRLLSSGEIVYGAKAPGYFAEINSLADARAHVHRLKEQGAQSIKNYNQPRREQRQQVVAAAIGENIMTVAEGGSLFSMDMTIIADGNTTLEHNIPQAKLYEDVLDFYGATRVGYNPTLVVTYGGLAADPYWRGHTDVWKHPLLSAHAPPRYLAAVSARRVIAPEEDYVDAASASQAKALADRGVLVGIGAHGQEEGLAAHWELWSFVRGGMSPLEALKAGTIMAARSLGLDSDIGSLEPGKLADLVIIDGDPLADIRDSDKISHVMLNGRLYDAATMNEQVTGTHARAPYYWEQ
ncbi:MAG: amidohydrolase family protein [Blastomonas sp.]